MPVKYLSAEWVDAHNAALAANESVRAALKGKNAAIQLVIAGAPQGEVHYWLHVVDGVALAGLGDLDDAEVIISQSYETAAMVSKGEMDGQRAFIQGKYKMKGKLIKMMQAGGMLAHVHGALATIETEY